MNISSYGDYTCLVFDIFCSLYSVNLIVKSDVINRILTLLFKEELY